jgi:hypothetical protein
MSNAFVEYYRCPNEHARFEATGPLSSDEGFFRFADVTCYGRCAGGRPAARVTDVTGEVPMEPTATNGTVRLPFDLSEVAANLRHERYLSNGKASFAAQLMRSVYYFARPLLPVPVRKHLQKVRLRDWQQIPFPRWPLDFSVDTLMERAMALTLRTTGVSRVPFIWFWPAGVPAGAILTHDIETTSGRDFCGRLMDINDEHGLKASFQIVPERRYDQVDALCSSIRKRGFEVNVHDLNHDGRLFDSRKRFEQRIGRVNMYGSRFQSRGFRAAAMYHNQAWYDRLQFSYDMSVPNAAHLEPQRGGCCTVMPYFVGGLVELPLTTTQDYSLFHILGQYSTTLWKQEIEQIIGANGLITLLTHPDYLIEERAQSTYRELLEHVRQLRAEGRLWFALPGDVERWWRTRSALRLVGSGDSWRIEGPGADRARVAYAVLENDRVVYKLS